MHLLDEDFQLGQVDSPAGEGTLNRAGIAGGSNF